MSTLYIDRRNIQVKLENDAMIFHEKNSRIGTVPLAPLERVYMRGNVALTTGLLGRLGQKGVGLVILSGRRGKPSLFLPRPHNDARLRYNQYRLASDPVQCLTLARITLQAKLTGQAEFLDKALKRRPGQRHILLSTVRRIEELRDKLITKSKMDSLRGLEGSAASLYFSAYGHLMPPSAGFKGRNRRPPRDPVNACLSLCYTLLHAEATLAAHGHGFDPYLGFLHELNFGRESLACDLVEPLRPHMDHFVWRLFADQTLRARDFSTEKDGACLMGKAAREKFYGLVEEPMEKVRRKLDNSLKNLRNYILDTATDD